MSKIILPMHLLQSYLDDAEGKKSTTSLAVSDDSLSRSTSDGSVNRDPNIIPPPPSIQQPNNDVYTYVSITKYIYYMKTMYSSTEYKFLICLRFFMKSTSRCVLYQLLLNVEIILATFKKYFQQTWYMMHEHG